MRRIATNSRPTGTCRCRRLLPEDPPWNGKPSSASKSTRSWPPAQRSSQGLRRPTALSPTPKPISSILAIRACCPCSTPRRCAWLCVLVSRSAHELRRARCSHARTISTLIFRRATRSVSTNCRSSPRGPSTSCSMTARASASVSRERISKRTLASRCMRVCRGIAALI